MPVLLCFETSTEICSVCISKSKSSKIEVEAEKSFQHASQITLLINKCLDAAEIKLQDIDAVVLSAGPGSYTGLRVGSSTAKGICYALEKPMITIDTLQSLAKQSAEQNPGFDLYCPMIDARRMEVYTAFFNQKNERLTENESKIIDTNSFNSFFDHGQSILFSGNGAPKCFEVIESELANLSNVRCAASNLVSLGLQAYTAGDFADIAYFSPQYLKPPNITKSKKVL